MAMRRNRKYAKEFARRLNARMEELGITPKRLAEQTGLPITTIYNYVYDNTRVPLADTVVKLAHALAMTTDELINFQV